MTKEIDLAYIAGFFDGEGCVKARGRTWSRPKGGQYNYVQLQITASNSDKAPLEYIANTLGGRVYKYVVGRKRKPSYVWMLHGVVAGCALNLLLPYLIVKKERAELGIECVSASKERKLEIVNEMHKLNKKGVDEE